MSKRDTLISSLICIIVGVLFLIFKGGILSILMTVFGAILIVYGIFDILQHQVMPGVIMIVIGVLVIVFGWVFVTAILYILGALAIIYGVYGLYMALKLKISGNALVVLLAYLLPCMYIVIGVLLLFNQGATVAWVFIVSGILLILNGVMSMLSALSAK